MPEKDCFYSALLDVGVWQVCSLCRAVTGAGVKCQGGESERREVGLEKGKTQVGRFAGISCRNR